MPPETVKEERKRKRTTQDAQDGSVQKTKKIKSEGKRNGAQLNGTTADVNISSPAPALESADQVVSTDRKQKNRKKSSAKSENATASTSREEVTESTVVVKLDISEQGKKAKKKKKAKSKESKQDEEHVVNGDAAEEQQVKKADTKDNAEKLRKFDHKQQKLIKKFETLEIQSRDGKVIGGELRELLKQTQKLVNKHKLDGDDELVKLLNRYDDARRDLWQMSRPVGGRYINHDPLFSKDEKHIILATANSIHVYEAESSLLLRTMYAHNISCYSLSSIHSHHLYVGNVYGDIHRFDWTTGQDLGTLSAGKGVCVRSAAPIQLRNTDEEVVFTIETLPKPGKKSRKTQSGGGDTPVDVLAIRKAPWEDGDEARQVLYRGNGRLQHLRILDHGKLVIIAGENDMVVGDLSGNLDFSGTTLADLAGRYRWRHLSCNQAISCLDAFLRVAASQDKSGRAKEGRSYSVAIGNAEGKVLVYDNIIEQLDILEDQGTNAAPRFRTLRWHREAPNTVKWSKDGKSFSWGWVDDANSI
jgi:NET1-associated nuclear protein 1 (U3 small nucleolar RNA-associated protein 17)